MIGIYKITNPKGKVYIGQSRNLKTRLNRYKNLDCKLQPKLFNSLKKYGWDNHILEIIHICEINELNIFERYYQDLYCVLGENGLNLCLTNDLEQPYVMSKEMLLHKSISQKGRKLTEEHKAKLKKAKENYVMSEEHLNNLRLSAKNKIGIKRPQHVIDILRAANLGKKASIETKLKQSESAKNRIRVPVSEATKKKISETLKGHIVSDELKQKISINTKIAMSKINLKGRKNITNSL